MAHTSTADYMASQLRDMGVTHVFALLGATNLDFVGAIKKQNINLVYGRHEQGVVAMADGYARFSGQDAPAICTVTQGAGLTNTTTSLRTALNAQSGVLLVVGDDPTDAQEQAFDQAAFCQLVSQNVANVTDTNMLSTELQTVLDSILAGQGVGIWNVRANLWRQPLEIQEKLTYERPPAAVPEEQSLEAAAQMLAKSKKPAILAGRGAVRSRADAAVNRLAEKLGAPIVNSLPSHGFAGDSAWHAGDAGSFGSGIGSSALQQADCIIAIGTKMSHWTLDENTATFGKFVIRIDIRESLSEEEKHVSLIGDARLTTEALTDCIPEQKRSGWFRASVPEARKFRSHPDALDPWEVLAKIDELLAEKRTIILDGGQFDIFAVRSLALKRGSDFSWTSDFSAIGQGLGVVLGASFARPNERITLIAGDGGFLMSIAELETLARYKLPVTIIVLNDQGYGQERASLQQHGGAPAGIATISTPDLAEVAKAYGIKSQRICTKDQLDNMVLTEEDHPILLDIRIDPAATTDFWSRAAAHQEKARRLFGTS